MRSVPDPKRKEKLVFEPFGKVDFASPGRLVAAFAPCRLIREFLGTCLYSTVCLGSVVRCHCRYHWESRSLNGRQGPYRVYQAQAVPSPYFRSLLLCASWLNLFIFV